MAGGFIAFRCSNFENTAEREQFRYLCNVLKDIYKDSDELCILIANYNMYDSEFDSILIKNDAICAIEFKNYGGHIIAQENGDWTSDGKIIKGGSRKTVYQQARINHAALKNGFKELGISGECIKDIPSIVVFHQNITISNNLSGKVRAWLHITDNSHFKEKVEDITCRSTNLSNADIVDIAIKMNLNEYIDADLSCYHVDNAIEEIKEEETYCSDAFTELLSKYNRLTPNHIYNLRPNQIFVFGTDRRGSQKYGAAGLAAKRFGAKVGVVEGRTGMCYALPTMGYTEQDLVCAVKRFEEYVRSNTGFTYLVTAVGCGHAGFDVVKVANMFKGLIALNNVMLPESFLEVFRNESNEACNQKQRQETNQKEMRIDSKVFDKYVASVHPIVRYLLEKNIPFNKDGGFTLLDEDGNVLAEAELGIESEKTVFSPFNSQSAMAFINNGFTVTTVEEYLNSKQK